MFESIKIYLSEELDIEKLLASLVEYGYRASKRVVEEGDYSRLGDTITIYPLTFEYPLRIELDQTRVERIRSVDPATYEPVEDHTVAIILPISGIIRKRIERKRSSLSAESSPIENFVDIESGDYVVHIDHGIGKYLGIKKLKADKKYSDYFFI